MLKRVCGSVPMSLIDDACEAEGFSGLEENKAQRHQVASDQVSKGTQSRGQRGELVLLVRYTLSMNTLS